MEKNREQVKVVIDIVVCIALCGQMEHEEALNKGHCLELLSLIAKHDPGVQNHLQEIPKNAVQKFGMSSLNVQPPCFYERSRLSCMRHHTPTT